MQQTFLIAYSKSMEKRFAVFDIDGTVLRWQFYHAIVHQLIKQGVIDKQIGKSVNNARMTWKQRKHHNSFRDYEDILYHAYLDAVTTISIADFTSAVDSVFDTYKDQVYTYSRDLIKKLQSEGYTLFAISGSHEEIVKKFGEYYGFDAVVGTHYVRGKDGFTGEEVDIVKRKGELLKEFVASHNVSWDKSIAVGDSNSDIAMLELVENPIAFNPNKDLYDTAKSKGWKIVVERKNVIYELESNDGRYVLA